MIDRPLYRAAWDELSAEKAMVFLAGPRQVGKTTLADWIAESFRNEKIPALPLRASSGSSLRSPR